MPALHRPLKLALALTALALVTPVASSQSLDAPPPPEPPSAETTVWMSPYAHVSAAQTKLDQAMVQQLEWELWSDVRTSVSQGLTEVSAALAGGVDRGLCTALRTTLTAVGTRQDLLEREAFAPGNGDGLHAGDEAALSAYLDGEYAAVSTGMNDLAAELAFVEGRLAQTTWLRVEILFEQTRDDEAQAALELGLALFPRDSRLHDQARAWADVLPAAEGLLNQLQDRIDTLDLADSDFSGLALETAAQLHTAMGRRRYATQEYELAALHFDRAGRALERSRGMPRKWSGEEVDFREADALVNGAYAWLGVALAHWQNGREDETAMLAASACEESLVEAMRTIPRHEAATSAVLWLGDSLLNKGDPSGVGAIDNAQARDFYGRMARKFDNPDWWNNYALMCRDTGTSLEARGEKEQAWDLYEKSYAAYTRVVELEPRNPRYSNDAALMLLYHLDRDLDLAAELFERSWMLGEEICNNPFVEQDVWDENFSAYTDAMLNLGKLYTDQQDYDQAEEVLTKLLDLAPTRMDAMMAHRDLMTARGKRS